MAHGDILDRLNDTRPVKRSTYNPFIPGGRHDLVVVSIEPYQNQEQHFCVRATFLVENSDNPEVQQGMQLDATWDLDRPPYKPGMVRDSDRFAAFLNALQGCEPSPTSHQQCAKACLKTREQGGQLEVQPCRGARIKAAGRTVAIKNGANAGKPWTIVDYDHVPQDQAAVATMRQALDQRMPYTYRPQAAPQPQAGWGAQPAAASQSAAPPAPAANAWSGFFPK